MLIKPDRENCICGGWFWLFKCSDDGSNPKRPLLHSQASLQITITLAAEEDSSNEGWRGMKRLRRTLRSRGTGKVAVTMATDGSPDLYPDWHKSKKVKVLLCWFWLICNGQGSWIWRNWGWWVETTVKAKWYFFVLSFVERKNWTSVWALETLSCFIDHYGARRSRTFACRQLLVLADSANNNVPYQGLKFKVWLLVPRFAHWDPASAKKNKMLKTQHSKHFNAPIL